MNEKRLTLILNHLGKRAFPDDTDPWTPIKNRLNETHQTMMGNQGVTQQSQRAARLRRIAVGMAMASIIVITILMFSPAGKTLADSLRHLFHVVSIEQLPTPSNKEMATSTYVPTSVAALVSQQAKESTPTRSPRPTSDLPPELVKACTDDLYGYACRVARGERTAGFDALEFPADPPGFHFREVNWAEPGLLWLQYDIIGGGGYLFLSQGLGTDFPPFTGIVPEAAIESVRVGAYPGEYVEGDFVIGGEYTTYTWLSCCRARLRWTDGERWFEIDKQAAMPQTNYMTRDVMIQMATELVFQPSPSTGPRLEHLVSIEEAEEVAEFSIVTPSVLPEKFIFEYASYNEILSQLRLTYSPPNTQGIASVVIIETPLEKVHLAPEYNTGREIKGETVDINGMPGIYFSDSPYYHAITWETLDLRITLSVYTSETYYGVSFTREQILEIARSMQ